jgi:hypothetical protein
MNAPGHNASKIPTRFKPGDRVRVIFTEQLKTVELVLQYTQANSRPAEYQMTDQSRFREDELADAGE